MTKKQNLKELKKVGIVTQNGPEIIPTYPVQINIHVLGEQICYSDLKEKTKQNSYCHSLQNKNLKINFKIKFKKCSVICIVAFLFM